MNKKILTLLVSLALLGSSCSDFLSVNEVNPNSASKVPAKLLLPAALNLTALTIDNPRRFEFVYLWYGEWSISTGYSQPQSLVQYKLYNTSYENGFHESYTTAQNFDEVIKAATDPKDVSFKAIGMIMKAYIMGNLVDCYGNVPYSEAFSASAGILKPKYDDQKTIYEDLILKLDEAIGLIQGRPADANEILGSSDIMFAGNMDLWAKFANTVKLRLLIHQSGMSGRDAYIKSAIATTASVGYLGAGEGGLVNPGYLNSTGKMNIFYETFYKADGSTQSDGVTYYNAGKDAVDFMNATADPRIGGFFNPVSGTTYAGNALGQAAPPLTSAQTSRLGYVKDDMTKMIGTYDKSAPILTDFESLFIQAEAAERGYISGSGKDFYNAAVTQSCLYMGVSSADAATFIASDKNTVNYDLAANKIDLILMQKWVALNGVAPIEIWTDYRRTGLPGVTIHFSEDPNKQNDTPPVRLLYPQREISVNNDNVVAVGPIDAFKSKIFWQNR